MPELLLARTLSIFTSQLLHEKKESKEEIDQAQKSWMTTKKTPDSPAANKWEFEQENFRKNVSWKLAKLVQFGETSLRTVEEIGYTSIGEIEGDSEPNDNEIHETEGSSETNLLESNYNKDYINSLSNSAITENEDEYDILNKKIQILIIQAQKALQRPCTEFDQFDIAIDDIGTDLEFFAFMNHIDEILQQAKTNFFKVNEVA
ncbi:hypothetical protein G9A89_022179 [Geosiphon pyriformis]|nr:hypothetical protein G9A89_022179 [Geosiphon pyriformis]